MKILSGIFLVLLFSSCTSLFYYPSHDTFYDPLRLGLLPEEVEFKTHSGETIHAWWFPAKGKSKGSIIYFHGNAENMTSHFIMLAWIPEENYSYLIFDYPGYGKSTGKVTQKATVESGHAAVEWVHANKDPNPLILYGQSLGGPIAMRTALELKGDYSFRAIILESTFASYEKIAAGKLATNWITWLLQPLGYLLVSDEYAPKDIKKLSPIPALVIHGQKDIVVEPQYGEQIYAELGEPKDIIRVPNGTHGSTYWAENKALYRKALVDYLNAHR